MCGIAGLIHKGKRSNVGGEMTAMLQAMLFMVSLKRVSMCFV